MKQRLISVALVLLSIFGGAGVALAGPVVLVGSNYSVFLAGSESGEPFIALGVFDELPSAFTRAGLNLILTESDTDLGGDVNRIDINLTADGDLFPIAGEQGIFGVGDFNNGLKLLRLVSLFDARIRLFDLSGNLIFDSPNLADQVALANPWDGYFPSVGSAVGIDGVGGNSVSHIMFEFQVKDFSETHIPEPGSIFLMGAALIAISVIRRQWRRQ